MSAWAYRCHPPDEGSTDWFVSQLDVEKLGPDVQIIRVKVGVDWRCALLDRTQAVTVENQMLREVIASNEEDCPQCAEMLAARTSKGRHSEESLIHDNATQIAIAANLYASNGKEIRISKADREPWWLRERLHLLTRKTLVGTQPQGEWGNVSAISDSAASRPGK
jgi:hypothetical protein